MTLQPPTDMAALRRRAATAVLVLLVLSLVGTALLSHPGSDHPEQLALAASEWSAGRVPLWNPDEGQPLAGNGQVAVFYPTTALYMFLAARDAAPLGLILRLAFGAWGVWLLLRRLEFSLAGTLIAAAAYALVPWAIRLPPLPLNVVPFVPWALLSVELLVQRASAPHMLAASAIIAIQFLGASIRTSAILLAVMAIYWAARLAIGVPDRSRLRIALTLPALVLSALAGLMASGIESYTHRQYVAEAGRFRIMPTTRPVATRTAATTAPATQEAEAPSSAPAVLTDTAWIAATSRQCQSPEDAAALYATGLIDVRRVVLLDPQVSPDYSPQRTAANFVRTASPLMDQPTVRWLKHTPQRMRFAIDGGIGGWLVVSDPYGPGWRAMVSQTLQTRGMPRPRTIEREVQISPAYGSIKAIPIQYYADPMFISKVEVTLEYAPRAFKHAAIISLGGLVIMLLLAGWSLFRDNSGYVPLDDSQRQVLMKRLVDTEVS